MALVYLGIGSNLGNKEINLNQAILKLKLKVGEIFNVSSFYASKPWGFSSDNDFLNGVVLINTHLPPEDLLFEIKKIEEKMGRLPKQDSVYEDRIIDIDILLYENRIIEQKGLIIPHNKMSERDFVLEPLSEIAPDLVHPTSGKTILQLRDKLHNS